MAAHRTPCAGIFMLTVQPLSAKQTEIGFRQKVLKIKLNNVAYYSILGGLPIKRIKHAYELKLYGL